MDDPKNDVVENLVFIAKKIAPYDLTRKDLEVMLEVGLEAVVQARALALVWVTKALDDLRKQTATNEKNAFYDQILEQELRDPESKSEMN